MTILFFSISSICAANDNLELNDNDLGSLSSNGNDLSSDLDFCSLSSNGNDLSSQELIDENSISSNPADETIFKEAKDSVILKDTDDGKFSTLKNKIEALNDDETIVLNNTYVYDDNFDVDGIIISKKITIDGNGFELDGLGKSRIFNIANANVTLKNIKFINGFSSENGGAIYADNLINCTFSNLTFENNNALNHGGAIYVEGNCSFSNFTDVILLKNTALRGGAIYVNGSIINDSFDLTAYQNHVITYSGATLFVKGDILYNTFNVVLADNHADHCAAGFYLYGAMVGNTFEGIFENNTGVDSGGVFTIMSIASNNTFKGRFFNNSAVHGGAIYFYNASYNNTFIGDFINNSALKIGSTIYFRGTPSNRIVNSTFLDNKAPSISLDITSIDSGFKAVLAGNNTVINAFCAKDISNMVFDNVTYWGENGLSNTNDALPICGNFASGQNIILEIYKGSQLLYKIINSTDKNGMVLLNYPKLDPGSYNYLIYHEDNSYYSYIKREGSIIIPKIASKISISNGKITYNTGKNVLISLKDNANNPIGNLKITVVLNGKKYVKSLDKNGQVKLTGLIPKTYKISISFDGNDIYMGSNLSSKIVVSKASSKLTAKNRSFKAKTKIKRYAVVLKNNKNKPIKSMKVSLKVKSKTYYAKTNSKGKAVFKITKLNKKGKFNAVIKFKGNKYYKAKTIKKKITIKP